MFTSRAEHRLFLRHDNADLRLFEKSYEHGLITRQRYEKIKAKKALIEKTKQNFRKIFHQGATLAQILKRPEKSFADLPEEFQRLPREIQEQVTIDFKYEGYIARQLDEIAKFQKLENMKLPTGMDYKALKGLRNEAMQKLGKIQPETLGQASRISGITQGDIAVLMVWLKRASS